MSKPFGIVQILNSPHGKKYTSLKRALMYHADGRAHYDAESNTLLFLDRAIVIAKRQREAEGSAKNGWPWAAMDSGKGESTGYADTGLAMQVMQMLTPQESRPV